MNIYKNTNGMCMENIPFLNVLHFFGLFNKKTPFALSLFAESFWSVNINGGLTLGGHPFSGGLWPLGGGLEVKAHQCQHRVTVRLTISRGVSDA